MAKITIRDPSKADIGTLLQNMRACDRAELDATGGSLSGAIARSAYCWSLDINGELALIGGVADISVLEGIGSPWMLGTETLNHFPGAVTRVGMRYRDIFAALYPVLLNYVDARNTKSIRWLKRLGFTVADEPVAYGPQNLPFYQFELRSPCAHPPCSLSRQ